MARGETLTAATTGNYCFATTGDADFHLRVVARDMAAYNRFLDEFIFKLPGIRHVRTNVILKSIKSTVALPL